MRFLHSRGEIDGWRCVATASWMAEYEDDLKTDTGPTCGAERFVARYPDMKPLFEVEQKHPLGRVDDDDWLTGPVCSSPGNEELQDWAIAALDKGGDFMKGFARSLLHADGENFAVLLPAAQKLFEKYPEYRRGGHLGLQTPPAA